MLNGASYDLRTWRRTRCHRRLLALTLIAILMMPSMLCAQSKRQSGASKISKALGRMRLGKSTSQQQRPQNSNRYLAMARQLLSESEKLAADGKIDAAIQLAERADTLMRVVSRTTPGEWPDDYKTPAVFLSELRAFQQAQSQQQATSIPVAPADDPLPIITEKPKPQSKESPEKKAGNTKKPDKIERWNLKDKPKTLDPKSAAPIDEQPLASKSPDNRQPDEPSPYQLLPFEVAAPKTTADSGRANGSNTKPIPSVIEAQPLDNGAVLPFVDSSPNQNKSRVSDVSEPQVWRPQDEQPIDEPPAVISEWTGIEPIPESEFLAPPTQSAASEEQQQPIVVASQDKSSDTTSREASLDKSSLWTMAFVQTISTFVGLLLGLIVFVIARFVILKRYGERLGWVLRVERVDGNNTLPYPAEQSAEDESENEENEARGATFEEMPFPFRVVGSTYADEKDAEAQREREREQAMLKFVFEQNLELQDQLSDLKESAA